MAPDEVPQPRLPLGVLERARGALIALLGDPIGDLGAKVEVHKVPAEIEAREVPVVAGAALGKFLVLRLRPVRRERVLRGGRRRFAFAAGTAVSTQEAHVDVERPRGVGGPQLLDDLGMRDAVVEQEAHLLGARVLAQGAFERRLGWQAGEQQAPEVQHHVLLQVLLLPESVLAVLAGERRGAERLGFGRNCLPPTLLHLRVGWSIELLFYPVSSTSKYKNNSYIDICKCNLNCT